MDQKTLNTNEVKDMLKMSWPDHWRGVRVFGVPRGGWNIACLLESIDLALQVSSPADADVIVDDIVDSGRTREKWAKTGKPFWAPIDKLKNPGPLPWYVFPWEVSGEHDARELITRQLEFIGEDPNREGLRDTPDRVVRSWRELYAGYSMESKKVLNTVFASENDAMVICKDIEFYSMCEHHMLPFHGTVSIGYLPAGRVVGLSKLARLVEMYARRLQIQEQMTAQIAKALDEGLKFEDVTETDPKLFSIKSCLGVGVVVNAKHHCMCGRGIAKQSSSMTTSAMLGKFRTDPAVRSEFLKLIGRD